MKIGSKMIDFRLFIDSNLKIGEKEGKKRLKMDFFRRKSAFWGFLLKKTYSIAPEIL